MMNVFKYHFEVRDYECDLQGIVNNSVYLNYLEHTRHQYIKSCGLDFKQLSDQGFDLVVIDLHIKYKRPLTSGDKFYVTLLATKESKLRFKFHQQVINSDGTIMVEATVIGTCMKDQRPCYDEMIFTKLMGGNNDNTTT